MGGTNQGHQRQRTIAFDFDGVVARYSGFVSHNDIQEPIADTVEAMRILREAGHKILIYSTRSDAFLVEYCEKYDVPYDYLNRRPDKEGGNPGKPIAYVYVDDRAVCYRGQSAEQLVQEITSFKAWWEGR